MAEIDDNVTVKIEGEQRRKPEDEVRHRKKHIYKSLKNQMEFYFGDANLAKDKFLIDLIERDKYVDLSIFLRFNKIRALTSNIEDIAKALRDSEILSVTEDGTKVCRTTPVQIKENEEDCTIYVEQLPPDADHEWLKRVFSSYGEVVFVSIPKYKPSNKIKGFAFVEFDTPEASNKTLEAFGAMGCRLPAQMPPDNLCSIATFEQTSEEDKNGEQTTDKSDSEQPVNQKKRKLENPDSSIDSEAGTDSGSSRKKKKKKQKGNECEETSQEAEKDEVHPSKATVENVGSGTTARKRKSKDSNPQIQHVDAENETSHATLSSDVDNESEITTTDEAKSKKQRQEQETEADNGDECEMKSEGVADESKDDNAVEETRKKKNRNRKRKKKVKQENDPSKLGLKILSKREWKRLRNKYLDLQRNKMKAVKQHLARARWGGQTPRAYSEDGENAASQHHEMTQQQTVASSDQPRTVFTPSVIAQITFDEPVSDITKFKSDVRTYSDVQYVDILDGTNEAYVRFSTPSSAAHFIEEKRFGNMKILSGDDEINYWSKIKQDRTEKFSQKIKVKQRGRDKLLKRAERELGKHIRFDE